MQRKTNYNYRSQLALLKEAHRLAGHSKDLLQEALENEKGSPCGDEGGEYADVWAHARDLEDACAALIEGVAAMVEMQEGKLP